MKRLGVFADISNLYYCILKKFDGRKIDYEKYMEFIKELGEIQEAIAYGAQMNEEAKGFIYALQQIGFKTKYKTPKAYNNDNEIRHKADWDVGITVDMMNLVLAGRLDMIILGTADGDMVDAVDWIRSRGVGVVTLACGISRDLKDASTKWIEIPESLLEDKSGKRPTNVPSESVQPQGQED